LTRKNKYCTLFLLFCWEVYMKSGIVCGVFLGAMAVNGVTAEEESIFTCRVGSFEVNMLVENRGQGRSSILIGADEGQLRQYIPGGVYPSATNTFLIRGLNQTILVDTGFGAALFESMKTLGVRPDDVDAVLITHMHGDHIGGLQKNGQALFPKAKVYLARQERDYWVNTNSAGYSGGAAAALAPYGSQVQTFLPGGLDEPRQELLPGITPIAAFGHTPGHTLFLVESGDQKMLIWGDLMHAQNIQFPLPGVSVTYDTDPAAAAAVRKAVLEYTAKNGVVIGGMHLVYPAVGSVAAQGEGYLFTPAK
jgi:glyoxylase-like metal-dependent hydrolase (beta-lactamase superfamily II)